MIRFSHDNARALSGYNLLTIEEPWVMQEPTMGCRDALTSAYFTARDLQRSPMASDAKALRDRCNLDKETPQWGFDAHSYQALVAAIGREDGLQYVGFVGYSFGSARLRYLAAISPHLPLEWAVLSRPFPVGISVEELVKVRGRIVKETYADLNRRRGQLSEQNSSSRSIPITEFDNLSAQIELGYLDEQARPQAARDIASGRRPALVARLSDQLWQRYGSNQIAPGYLAQIDELCSAITTGSPTSSAGVEGILWRTLAPCSGRLAASPVPFSLGNAKVCIAASSTDTVAPQELAQKVFQRVSTNVRWNTQESSAHRSEDGLGSCLDWAVGPG